MIKVRRTSADPYREDVQFKAADTSWSHSVPALLNRSSEQRAAIAIRPRSESSGPGRMENVGTLVSAL